ncbi:MAG: hypothetical protein M3Y87_10825 [Myxococcota bacterium]|nr:hypothetical protein [Myxococcota bacterium]
MRSLSSFASLLFFTLASPILATPILAALSLAGCDCGGDPPPTRCSSASECPTDQVCVDARCVPRATTDGSVPGPDAARDAAGCVDFDRDGLCAGTGDCDDTDPMRGGAERCDGADNDCDGTVDEGLVDICTECRPSCEVEMIPGADGWMPTAENSEGVIVDPSGALTLGRTMATAFSVWVANSDEATVSKLDSRTNRELARYPTVGAMAPAGTRMWNERCGWGSPAIGNCPSRTAVDQNFDAYVANRAFGNQGSITKYANREEDCVDRNGNGVIDTSRDLNGDGTIDLAPAAGEFVGPDDECILWTSAAGGANGVPRALTIGIAPPDGVVGDIWVGLFNERQACRLSPVDGSTIACMPIGGLQPYGATSDSMGRIWFVDRSGSRRDVLGWIDPFTMAWTGASPVPDFGSCPGALLPYGITPDGEGRIYVASSSCDPPVLRYSPATDTWDGHSFPGGGTPRGMAADETHLWVSISHTVQGLGGVLDNRVAQFRLSDMAFVTHHTIPTGRGPVGVGVSFDGSVWAICQGTNSAARLDPAAGTWIEHGVGLTPYTYSDFIGFGLNVFAEPRGRYRFVVEGCDPGEFGAQRWLGARVNAEIPPMTEVTMWVRTADTRDALAAATFIGPFAVPTSDFSMPPGPIADGQFIEVELRLRTDDRRVAPRVLSVDLAGECGGGS